VRPKVRRRLQVSVNERMMLIAAVRPACGRYRSWTGAGSVETEPLVEHAANNRNARLADTDTIRDFLIRPPTLELAENSLQTCQA